MSARGWFAWSVALGIACSVVGCRALFRRGEPAATDEVDAAAAPSAAADESAIPTPQDFEEEAAEKVTAATFKAELARLKKEIAAK